MENIAKAIIKVMQEVKGIDKTMTIGTGQNSYKGVPDKEVKKIIGDAMAKNGLCILPTKVTPKIQIDRWEAAGYNGSASVQKQSIFTEVTTEYLLLHESGESITLSGYGHGIDSQDKGAGKATTYALKYALLYLFVVPTGKIDDADVHHSDSIEIPKEPAKETPVKESNPKTLAEYKALVFECGHIFNAEEKAKFITGAESWSIKQLQAAFVKVSQLKKEREDALQSENYSQKTK